MNYRAYYFNKILPIFLSFFAATIVFREFSAYVLALLFIISLIFYKEIYFNRKKTLEFLFISIPLLLQIIFFWNNESFYEAVKEIEKYTAYLVLPLIIVFQKSTLNIEKILNWFSIFFTTILFFGILKYIILNFDSVAQYINGELAWQMGYAISNSLGSHAPALNLHISFLCFINLHLLLCSLKTSQNINQVFLKISLLLISISALLIINTRLAIFVFFIGAIVLILFQEIKNAFKYKIVIGVSILILTLGFLKIFPSTMDKFINKTFNDIEKVGQLDEINNPEEKIYGSLVTRLTVWKTVLNISSSSLFFGHGVSAAHSNLFYAYENMNQKFLAKYKFKVHNQFLDFLLKFGILGIVLACLFFLNILRLALKLNMPYIFYFFVLFSLANMVDDFLIRYDGIVFSAFWISVFSKLYIDKQKELKLYKAFS